MWLLINGDRYRWLLVVTDQRRQRLVVTDQRRQRLAVRLTDGYSNRDRDCWITTKPPKSILLLLTAFI